MESRHRPDLEKVDIPMPLRLCPTELPMDGSTGDVHGIYMTLRTSKKIFLF